MMTLENFYALFLKDHVTLSYNNKRLILYLTVQTLKGLKLLFADDINRSAKVCLDFFPSLFLFYFVRDQKGKACTVMLNNTVM